MSEKITILYVDDEPINLELFEMNFQDQYSVLTANSGLEGLEILSINSAVKIVFSDMKMPGMNGVAFIRKAKKDYPSIHFFILTGFEITEEISEAMNEKIITKYFRKPFKKQVLESAINEIIEKYSKNDK